MIFINAEGNVMGRLASFAAKKALAGETVAIVNAEKAVITGSKQDVMNKLATRHNIRGKGNPEKGPKFSRMPDRVLRRSIRGMLPWKSSRGREAFRRVQVYLGMPEQFSGKEFAEIPGKGRDLKKSVLLGEVCKLGGAKW